MRQASGGLSGMKYLVVRRPGGRAQLRPWRLGPPAGPNRCDQRGGSKPWITAKNCDMSSLHRPVTIRMPMRTRSPPPMILIA